MISSASRALPMPLTGGRRLNQSGGNRIGFAAQGFLGVAGAAAFCRGQSGFFSINSAISAKRPGAPGRE